MAELLYLIAGFLTLCALAAVVVFLVYSRIVDEKYLGSPRFLLGALQYWFLLLPLSAAFALAYYTLLGPATGSGSPTLALVELPVKLVLYPYLMWISFALTLVPSALFGLMQQLYKAELTLLYNTGFQRRYVLY